MNTFQKEHISITRKILLIFVAVLLIELFLFAISLSLATSRLVQEVTYLRINDYLTNAQLFEDDSFLKETAGEYMECVVVYINEDDTITLEKSKGLHKLISDEQLEETLILIKENITNEEFYFGEIATSFGYNYYGAAYFDETTIVIGISSDDYLNTSIFQLIAVVITLYIVIFIIGAVIILLWSHSVVKRLDKLCTFIVDMPENEYKKVYIDEGDDEVYQLSLKIDDMRRTIISDAVAKQAMLQNVSHDLKTPVAVIKSYAEAMEDGIEDISATSTIIEQCNKLEKKVKRFIEFNKLEYLSDDETKEIILMKEIILEVIPTYKHISHVKIETTLDDTVFSGRYENYYTIVENIIENALRYANTVIKITLKDGVLTIYNDGKHIDEQFINEGFKPYEKGSQGKFGLGMSIVCRTLDIFNMKLVVKNEKVGVSFIIKSKTL